MNHVQSIWPPFPGDPTLLGWTATAGYALAAWLCVRAGRQAQAKESVHHDDDDASRRTQQIFWFSIALLMAAMGLNKQLDLQTLLTNISKEVAHAQGWYEHRRIVQAAFASTLALVIATVMGLVLWKTRRLYADHITALFGLGLLAGFVVLRAVHFTRTDELLGIGLSASRGKWALELGGIVCIALCAWRHARHASHTESATTVADDHTSKHKRSGNG